MHIDPSIPRHVAIIMDGNGRWARERGLDRVEGHIQGVESVRNAFRSCVRTGVRYLTLYVFSTENKGRPSSEVSALMDLFCQCVASETPELVREGVAVHIIGQRDQMDQRVRDDLALLERDTARGQVLDVYLALGYGSRQEIVSAVRNIAVKVAGGSVSPEDIDEQMIHDNLYTSGVPDPDLLIRTGGDHRISNFLLWQLSYSELYFTPVFWPDFGSEEFDAALESYRSRERRFGLVKNEKMQNTKDEA